MSCDVKIGLTVGKSGLSHFCRAPLSNGSSILTVKFGSRLLGNGQRERERTVKAALQPNFDQGQLCRGGKAGVFYTTAFPSWWQCATG